MPAHALFFPAAALYAAAVVPLSLLAMLGIGPAIAGLALPAGHGHELVFGFALAAVAGHQLGPTPRAWLAALFGLWLAARVSFLAAPGSMAAALANGAFAALLAWRLVPRLARSAKRRSNQVLPAALAALCASAVVAQASWVAGAAPLQHGVLRLAVLLLALLMLFMGGRIIAPIAAGAAYRLGFDLGARVQPRIEGALLAAMLAAIGAALAGESALAGATLIAAAVLAATRLLRWRPWAFRRRPDVLALVAGYGWLALGLAGMGAALLLGERLVASLHLITVGGLGTLSINVMARAALREAGREPATTHAAAWATLLIAIATLARVAADFGIASVPLLLLAAACWSLAFLGGTHLGASRVARVRAGP